ncbi:MAG: AraC family transcriptional regulator [Ramlibacter sp.]|nr:AraC family transcriptional regulator [Ramlibacter sp.]
MQWLKGVLKLFASRGMDTARLLEETGIEPERLLHAHERFGVPEINRLWELAVARSGEAALGLDRHLASRHIDFTIAAQPMGSSPTLRAGLETLAHYLELIDDAAAFTMVPRGADAWLALEHGGGPGIPRQRVEFGMLVLLILCRRVTRHSVRPLAAEFIFREPANFHPYRMAFECPVRFDQTGNRLLLAQDDLALPLVNAHSPFVIQERLLEQRLARRAQAPTRYRASEEIVLRLSLGEPTAQETARALGLTEPVLVKRLKAENSRFDTLLDELRRELALGYIRETSIPMTRVPALLGYDSPRDFAAACQRWFGSAPADLRHHPEAEPLT